MAKIKQGITFTGTIGELTAYTMRGTEGVVVRAKGGVSRQRLKTSPAYTLTRLHNAEFSGRATASKWIMRMLWPLKAVADYNISGPLNALLKPVQELDGISALGKRHVQLSKSPQLLAGFSLNRKTVFDGVLRTIVSFSLSRENYSADLEIPTLLPGVNFFPASFPYYSLRMAVGMVPDVFFKEEKYQPASPIYSESNFAMAETPWLAAKDSSAVTRLKATLPNPAPDDHFTLVLSIGIRYGSVMNGSVIEQVKYAGCAKVLAVF